MQNRFTVAGAEKRLLSFQEAMTYIGSGRKATMDFATDCGAVVRLGRRVLIDKRRIDEHIDQLQRA